jgi:chromate transporter
MAMTDSRETSMTGSEETSRPLRELAFLFLKLGTIAFGGPAAHIAMMEEEVVRRRGWLTREEFLDLLGATNLIPGPNSTEMAIHIGARRAGFAGLAVAGGCFILPAMCIVTACAWAYVRFGTLPEATGILYGVKPVIIAVVLQALWGLGKTAIKSGSLGLITIAAVAANFLGANELLVLLVAGGVMILAATAGKSGTTLAVPLPALFLIFLKIGSVLYGSGYVLLAFLRSDLVERLGWLNEAQLLDAVAVGQVTPGPVFTTATFIGYVLGGPVAGVVATVGIFLPAFFFVAISGPLIPRIRKSKVAGAFLDGVNAASLALMIVVTWQLGRAAIVDVPTSVLAMAAGVALIRFRVNSAWLVLAGAIVGLTRVILQ